MSAVIIVLAILAFYFYRKAKNPNAYDEFSEDQLFKRLWYLPIVQLVVCLVVFFLGYGGVQICLQQSPWLADAVRDNFGIFGTIGAELINQNLQDNLAPVLVQADRLHGWSQYLLYAAIISLGLQVFALKEKKVSMEIILGTTGIISVAAIYLAFKIACTMDMAMNVVLSNETFGLLSNYPGHAIEQGLGCAGILFIILTIYHYGHYNYLARYYGEPAKNINPMSRFVRPTNIGETPQQEQPEPLSQPSSSSEAASTGIWKWIAIAAVVALGIAIAIAVSSGGSDAPIPQSPQSESESEDFIEEIPEEGYDLPDEENDYKDFVIE